MRKNLTTFPLKQRRQLSIFSYCTLYNCTANFFNINESIYLHTINYQDRITWFFQHYKEDTILILKKIDPLLKCV